jgi:predicted small lipoprotein YifL
MLLRPKFLSRFLTLISMLVALLAASSCGLKGPLYRPDEPQKETVTPAGNAEAGKKKPGESTVQPPATDPDRPAVPPGH